MSGYALRLWPTAYASDAPKGVRIDFWFDKRAEKKVILETWDDYLKHRPDKVRPLYGEAPKFEDDADFLPLQAADFWAWWVRKWHKEGKRIEPNFGTFGLKAQKDILVMDYVLKEDDVARALKQSLAAAMGSDYPVYDVKVNIPND
jgi:hypothetical protein